MAITITIGPTATLSLPADTAYQLLAASGGHTNFCVLNTGPGNLYLRYGQPPAIGDPASIQLPVGTTFTSFPVSGGATSRDGIYVLADLAGGASVLSVPNR